MPLSGSGDEGPGHPVEAVAEPPGRSGGASEKPHAGSPPTEAELESTRELDRWDTARIVAAIHAEDRRAVEAVGRVLPQVAAAAERLVRVLGGGGRLFYVGAGTSGRMGLLDAAELPPTFGLDPDRVQALLAGGPAAFERAVEGAEDRGEEAAGSSAAAASAPGTPCSASRPAGAPPTPSPGSGRRGAPVPRPWR